MHTVEQWRFCRNWWPLCWSRIPPVFYGRLIFTSSKELSLYSILSQLNLIHILTFCSFVMVFNIILPPRGVLEPVCTCQTGAYRFKQTTKGSRPCVTASFRSDIHEICSLLGSYAACNGKSLPAFWDNLSIPTSRVKISKNIGFLSVFLV